MYGRKNMFGKRNRNQSPDGFHPGDEYIPRDGYGPDEYASGYTPDEYADTGDPEAFSDEYAPEGYADGGETGGEADGGTEKTYSRSIFRPATRKPNFLVSVLVNAVRVFLVIGLLAVVAGFGALAGIAKGYVDTSPELDLVALKSPNQKTTFYDLHHTA